MTFKMIIHYINNILKFSGHYYLELLLNYNYEQIPNICQSDNIIFNIILNEVKSGKFGYYQTTKIIFQYF